LEDEFEIIFKEAAVT